MAPQYDYRCPDCNERFTAFWPIAERNTLTRCPNCDAAARRLITISAVDCSSECPKWIASCRDVADAGDGRPETAQFLKDPTRENYEKWKTASGLRHLEPGETRMNRIRRTEELKAAEDRVVEETLKGFQKDQSIKVS